MRLRPQILKEFPQLEKMQHNSAEYLHLMTEALRLAFADGGANICDPSHSDNERAQTVRSLSTFVA